MTITLHLFYNDNCKWCPLALDLFEGVKIESKGYIECKKHKIQKSYTWPSFINTSNITNNIEWIPMWIISNEEHFICHRGEVKNNQLLYKNNNQTVPEWIISNITKCTRRKPCCSATKSIILSVLLIGRELSLTSLIVENILRYLIEPVHWKEQLTPK